MEDKQLNFNQPILSVRRSKPAAQKNDRRKNESFLPTKPPVVSFRPELKSGPLTNPGSVPFVWEHIPGRPKDETSKQSRPKERPPSIPKLPPGRVLKPKHHETGINTEDAKSRTIDRFGSWSLLPTEEKATKFESSKQMMEESSDDDETYMDALDTLSRGDSSFYNCSLSGVSGLETDGRPSGAFVADPRARDFMMERFLPAAKAMTSEAPQHAPKKHPIEEKPQEVKTLVKKDNTKPQLRYGPNFLQDLDHGDDDEDSDYDYDETGNISSKVCGLLPRFCLKGSFLNPVSGLSMRTRLPTSRTHASSSSASSFSETDNEPARVAVYEHRSFGGPPLAKQTELKESDHELTSPKKGLMSFKELLADENKKETTNPLALAVEKTLYVDTVHKTESPKAGSVSSSTRGRSNSEEHVADVLKARHITSKSFDSGFLDDKSKQDVETETQTGFCKDHEFDGEHEPTEAFSANSNDDQEPKISRRSMVELPAPPPLPKSPSDSWLWRTLPSVSSKHMSVRSNRKHLSLADPKSDKNIENSQGLLLPIPET